MPHNLQVVDVSPRSEVTPEALTEALSLLLGQLSAIENESERRGIANHFRQGIFPLAVPLGVDPSLLLSEWRRAGGLS